MDGVRRYLASLASSLSTLSPRSPLRLERENELEDQRRRTLVAEGKLPPAFSELHRQALSHFEQVRARDATDCSLPDWSLMSLPVR